MAIQMRGGLKVDFDPWKMKPKEWAVSVDPETENQIVWMCFRPGVVKRMGTYEDFREQIMEITDEIAEEFSQTINEIKVYMEGLKDATEGYKNATEGYKNTAVEKALESSNSATQASQSATNASQSATNSANSADLSEDYSKQAKSYAKGTGGEVRPNDDSDCAEFYYEQVKRVAQGIEGIIPMGTITFAELSEEYNQVKGYMFDISDDFVSDERFKNGVGIYYGAGSNVIYTADGMWDVLTPVSVMGVKGDKETVYRQGFVNLTPKDIGAATIEDLEGINADFIGTEEELNAKIASGEVTDGMTVFLRDVDGGGPGGDTVVGDLTPGKALVSDAEGNVASSSVTTKELEYMSGATSNIQQQIDNINSSGVSDISDATVTFTEASTRENVNSGEDTKTLWGKVKKLFSDLKSVAFSNDYNDLDNKPIIPTIPIYSGAVTTILNDDLPTNKVLVSDENGKVAVSGISKTQLGYLDGLTGNVQEQINNIGTGGGLTITDVLDLIVSPILEENSWNIINAVAINHLGERYWSVGNTKETKIKYNNIDVPVVFEIIGFEHDELSDSRTGEKANLTFYTKFLFGINDSNYKFSSNPVNPPSYMDTFLNTGTSETLLNGMPEGLKRSIKSVKKEYNRVLSGTNYSDFVFEILEEGFKIFVLSRLEMGRGTIRGTLNLGEKYDGFEQGQPGHKAFYDNPGTYVSDTYYWQREVFINNIGNPGQSVLGAQDGRFYADNMSSANFLSFAFCI